MPTILSLLLMLAPAPVESAELDWQGHYRARGLLYDSLSVSNTNPQSEGTSHLVDHRLRLQPRWMLSERVALFAQVDALDLVPWGRRQEQYDEQVSTVSPVYVPSDAMTMAFEHSATAPTDADGAILASSLSLTRAWAEVYSDIGRFRFGRVPIHWGAGIFMNDGFAPDAEYGDTSDRLQFTSRLGLIYLMAAWELIHEGYVNEADDMAAANFSVAYLTETMGIGIYNHYRYQPSRDFRAYAGDIWFQAAVGPATVEAEFVGLFGRGDLGDGFEGMSISALGGMLRSGLDADRLQVNLEGGFATGDSDPDDSVIRTFSFDRDHNVSLLLFEEPMPMLAATTPTEANQGRSREAVLVGEGIRNALYIRPSVGYRLLPSLQGELAAIMARTARLPEELRDFNVYGTEIDLTLRYDPFEHVWVSGTAGVLLPGSYFQAFEEQGEVFTGFDRPVVGARLMGTVSF